MADVDHRSEAEAAQSGQQKVTGAVAQDGPSTSSKHRNEPPPTYTWKRTLEGHTKSVVSVKFSHEGRFLASASADKTAKIWDTATWECTRTLEGHTKGLTDVAWHSSTQYVATSSDDLTIKLWQAESGECLQTLTGHTHYVFCVAFNPVAAQLVSGSFDETVRMWNVQDGTCLRVVPAHSDPVTAVDYSRDGAIVVSSSFDGLCRIWDSNDGKCLKTVMDDSHPPISHVRFSPNGRYMVTSSLDNQIKLWDFEKEKCLKTYKGHVNQKHCIFATLSVTDKKGKWVISGSEDHSIYIWHLNGRHIVQKLEGRPDKDAPGDGHCDVVLTVSCHPQKSIIASGALDADCTIKIWADNSDESVEGSF